MYICIMTLPRTMIVLLLANTFMVLFGATVTLLKSFEIEDLVPHVVPKAPAGLLSVKYPSGIEVQEGNELTPTQVKDIPTVSWQFSPENFYTLVMTDPSPVQYSEWQHWLVGNIPGGNVASGETLSAYIGSGPPKGTGFHRYVFLVYEQLGKMSFQEPLLNDSSIEHRDKFSVAKFAEKYKLGDPIAGNFYMCQYDDYVPILYKQIGI